MRKVGLVTLETSPDPDASPPDDDNDDNNDGDDDDDDDESVAILAQVSRSSDVPRDT